MNQITFQFQRCLIYVTYTPYYILLPQLKRLPLHGQTSLSEETAYKVKNEAFSKSKIEELAQFMTDDLGSRLAASQMKLRAEKMVVDKL